MTCNCVKAIIDTIYGMERTKSLLIEGKLSEQIATARKFFQRPVIRKPGRSTREIAKLKGYVLDDLMPTLTAIGLPC